MQSPIALILILVDSLHRCSGVENDTSMTERNASYPQANHVRKYEFEKNHSSIDPAIDGEQTTGGNIFAEKIAGLHDETMHGRVNDDGEDSLVGGFVNSHSSDRGDPANEIARNMYNVDKDDDRFVDFKNDFQNEYTEIGRTSRGKRILRRQINIRTRRSIIDDLMKVYRRVSACCSRFKMETIL